MHDVRLLLWLRARHARSALNRTLHLVGAGVDDGGWGERAYQLYAVGIMLVWAALMAAALVDAIQRVFVGPRRRRMLARGSGGAARGGRSSCCASASRARARRR